jgi:multidrug efflux pump subunit AcrB
MIQKRSYQIILLFIILTFAGIAIIPQLSIQLNPTKSAGSIVVSFSMPNASPEVLEQQIMSKIEAGLNTLQGIKKLSSNSLYNYGYITLELDKRTDLDQIRFEVAMLIRQIYPKLPKEASYPIIQLNSPEESQKQESFMTLQFSGAGQPEALSKHLEEHIKPKLASINGIYEVNIYGGNRLEYLVKYQKKQLDALQISEIEISEAIRKHFGQESIGIKREENGKAINVVLNNLTPSPSLEERGVGHDWKIPINNLANRIVYLTDIATVNKKERPISQFYRINGSNAINVVIVSEKGANQIKLSGQIKEALVGIKQTLPPTYQLNIEQDASEYIVENLQKIAIQAGLAIIILLIFVGISVRKWWYIGLITMSLIVNFALSFILFYFFKVEIHLYSLAALTTSLGIIIDNTIVMVDHYQRYRNLKVFMGLLGATLTTIAGLVVIFFLPQENRIELGDFSMVMLITLLVSLPVALFFVPAVMERMKTSLISSKSNITNGSKLKVKLSHLYLKFILILKRFPKTALLLAILAFGTPIFMIPDKIEGDSKAIKTYNQLLGNEWFQENVRPIMNKWLGGTMRLFAQYVYEGSFYQSPERTILYANAGLPNNSTIEQMNDIFLNMEAKVNQFKEVDKCITNVYDAQNGMMSIYFTPEAEEAGFPYRMKSILIQQSTEMSGIDWNIYGIGQGFSQGVNDTETPNFNVKMTGYNYYELEKQALRLKTVLEKHTRIQEVNINKSMNWYGRKSLFEYTLNNDEKIMSISNITKIKLSNTLTNLSAKQQPDLYILSQNEYFPVKVIPAESENRDIWKLNNEVLKIDSSFVSLKDISKISKVKVMPEIIKEDQQYLRMVSFTYYGSEVFGNQFLKKTLKELNPTMPIGYKAFRENLNWLSENKETKMWLIGLVFLLIYIICAIIFESLLQPLALILIIPLSFIGVFLTFYCFDFNFDQGGYASFILLSGNVVSAAIFIITEFNILKAKYPKASEVNLYVKAFNHKLIPIISTVLSTVFGLIPFLIYGEKEAFWFAFGVGAIGGLMMSLLVIPIYLPLFLRFKIQKKGFNK